MDVKVAHERAFALTPALSMDQAREKAWSQKLSVFGGLSSLLSRPKDDDITINRYELRYEPFWHVAARCEQDYEIRGRFDVALHQPTTTTLTLDINPDSPIDVTGGSVQLDGVARCRDESASSAIVDGISGDPQPEFERFLRAPKQELKDLGSFDPSDGIVIAPEVRSSFVVRQQLASLWQAVHADRVHAEIIEVTALALFFRPVYAFEYEWAAKSKKETVELDGVTAETRSASRQVGSTDVRLNQELLFDISAEAASMFVPGAGIAMKVGKLVVERTGR